MGHRSHAARRSIIISATKRRPSTSRRRLSCAEKAGSGCRRRTDGAMRHRFPGKSQNPIGDGASCQPCACLRHVFTELPKTQSLGEVEALPPARLDPHRADRGSGPDRAPAAAGRRAGAGGEGAVPLARSAGRADWLKGQARQLPSSSPTKPTTRAPTSSKTSDCSPTTPSTPATDCASSSPDGPNCDDDSPTVHESLNPRIVVRHPLPELSHNELPPLPRTPSAQPRHRTPLFSPPAAALDHQHQVNERHLHTALEELRP